MRHLATERTRAAVVRVAEPLLHQGEAQLELAAVGQLHDFAAAGGREIGDCGRKGRRGLHGDEWKESLDSWRSSNGKILPARAVRVGTRRVGSSVFAIMRF
jgi:hypothetical protein